MNAYQNKAEASYSNLTNQCGQLNLVQPLDSGDTIDVWSAAAKYADFCFLKGGIHK